MKRFTGLTHYSPYIPIFKMNTKHNDKLINIASISKLDIINSETLVKLKAVNNINKYLENGAVDNLGELKKDFAYMKMNFSDPYKPPKVCKPRVPIRYSMNDSQVIRDPCGKYVYSMKFGKLVEKPFHHKLTKRQKDSNLDNKRFSTSRETSLREPISREPITREPITRGLKNKKTDKLGGEKHAGANHSDANRSESESSESESSEGEKRKQDIYNRIQNVKII